MKTTITLYGTTIVFFAVACSSCQQQNDNLPSLDLSKNYPEKEVLLTDIADVTYLHINANDEEYLYSGSIVSVTEHTILIADNKSGDFLFFSRDGSQKSHFNRKGRGPEEYISTRRVFYDEEMDNVYVVDDYRKGRIQVYSSAGKHKHEINLPQGTWVNNDIVSFDDHSLFFYDASIEYKKAMENDFSSEVDVTSFYLISKENGAVLDYLELPIVPIFIGTNRNGIRVPAMKVRLLQSKKGILLCNPESDTVFLYGKDRSLSPILYKTPLIGSTSPLTYMNNCIDTEFYQFIDICTVVPGIPDIKHYLRDKQTGEIFRQRLLLKEYEGKEFIISPTCFLVLYRDGCFFELGLIELKQAYRENKLSGKLKELVATLKEDDNSIYVMAQFK